jgi:hypothetical protein
MQFIEPTKRLAVARLANVVNSPAPDALTSAARVLHSMLSRNDLVQEHEFLDADDALAEAIADLPGLFAMQLDFLGILHGKDAQLSQHRQRNIGAALREKSARLGRPPTEADFPSGHPVPLFSYAYWGGVTAWADGSPNRAQHPKGFWADKGNQIAAIQALAARYPTTAITHALLHAAGLHRLGLILDAAGLQGLADEAGVERSLIYRPRSFWTADRVIDAYAEQCRRAEVTLSTTALTAIGGEACSLKSYAAAHFADFRAFQRAVVARHPDIKLPDRPTAADGTELDSWSEVPVYNALRMALPECRIDVHVILEGDSARSADFVVDGKVWVEVLGIAIEAMPYPTSARQAKYAADWKAKSARYAALGIDPVVVEPEDIHDAGRLAARVAEVAARLQRDPVPPTSPGGKRTRAKGSWTFQMVCAAVEEVANGGGTFPTHEALARAGFGHACMLLRQRGMRHRVASALTLTDTNCKGRWSRERVVGELADWMHEHGSYPTNAELKKAAHSPLCSARSRLWAGEMDALRLAVGERVGMEATPRRAPDRSYTTVDQVAAALKPLALTLGRMPTAAEAAAAGLSTAWAHASRRTGVARMAEMIGVPCASPPRRTVQEMLDELRSFAASLGGERLTTSIIRERLGSGAVAWVRKCGGMEAVRKAIAGSQFSGSPKG